MQFTKNKCISFQFAVLMWLLTYVGALFNGLTLLILGEVTSTHTIIRLLAFCYV